MGDKVTCTAVLSGPPGHEYLCVDTGRLPYPDLRNIPVRPKGEPRRFGGSEAEWEYEDRGDGVLHMTPSLLCPDTGPPPFHTDYNWTVKFERLRAGDWLDRFEELNPRDERPRSA